MDSDRKTLKLFSYSAALNTVALIVSAPFIHYIGVLEGLAVFTIIVLLLPLVAYYRLSKKVE